MTVARLAPSGLSPHSVLLRATLLVAAASLFVKLLAMIKEMAIAASFGRTDALEAYLAAMVLPALMVNLLAESLNQALVPTLIKIREQRGSGPAQSLFSASLLGLLLLLLAVSLALVALAPLLLPWIGSGFDAGKNQLALRLFPALLPTLLFSGVANLCAAVLVSRNRFFAPTLAPALISISTLAALTLPHTPPSLWTLVCATLAGSAAQALLLVLLLPGSGYRFTPRFSVGDNSFGTVARLYLPALLSALAASGGLLVDQAMAASLKPGSLSALAYANRFVGVALTLLAGAISTAITPSCARFVAHNQWQACRSMVRHWVLWILLAATPVALLLAIGSRWLISLTLQHGHFQTADTAEVARVLSMYALQIPFFSASRVDYRLLLSACRTDLVMLCGFVNLALDVALNLILMRFLGVAGIALATSLWTLCTFLLLRYSAEKILTQHCRPRPEAP